MGINSGFKKLKAPIGFVRYSVSYGNGSCLTKLTQYLKCRLHDHRISKPCGAICLTSLELVTDRPALLAYSVCMKPNFQGLLWDEFGGLGEDELKNCFCSVNDLIKLLRFYF